MILPNKYINEKNSLIGVGALLIQHITSGIKIYALWDMIKNEEHVGTYERFILSLDFLYLIGLVDFKENCIIRNL